LPYGPSQFLMRKIYKKHIRFIWCVIKVELTEYIKIITRSKLRTFRSWGSILELVRNVTNTHDSMAKIRIRCTYNIQEYRSKGFSLRTFATCYLRIRNYFKNRVPDADPPQRIKIAVGTKIWFSRPLFSQSRNYINR